MSDQTAAVITIGSMCLCGTALLCVRYYFQYKFAIRELEMESQLVSGNKATSAERADSTRRSESAQEHSQPESEGRP